MATSKVPKGRKPTDLTPKELALLRKTSKLTDKEIKLWHEEFIKEHPTGKLDKKAFSKLLKELNPDNKSAASPEVLFDLVDTNRDGTIDFSEFLFLAAVTEHQVDIDERLDLMFSLWDVSNDGHLDQSELAHLISAIYDRAGVKDRHGENNPQSRAKAIIKKLDINDDKKLNKEEFISGCKKDEIIGKFLASGE